MKKSLLRWTAYVVLYSPFFLFLTAASDIEGGGCSNASISQFAVTPSGENVSIDPADPQMVNEDSTASFAVTANEGYTLSNSVDGTCPTGTWASNVYTTGAVTSDCTLIFSAVQSETTYLVTPSAGSNGSISPSTLQEARAGANLDFTATPDAGYEVDSWYVDNGLVQTGGTSFSLSNITADHTVDVTFSASATSLSVSTSELALSVTGWTEYGVSGTPSSGLPRTLTLTNLGSSPATGLNVQASGLPTGSSISGNTCGSVLAASDSCTITITPGANASSDCGTGIAPTPAEISFGADNATPVTADVVVLTYGCIYQGGYLFWMDDSYPESLSIGGRVVTQTDQAAQSPGVVWASNGTDGTGANVSYDVVPLISEITSVNDDYVQAESTFNATYSNTGAFPFPASEMFFDCDGSSVGGCNTANISMLYSNYITNYGIGGSPYTLSAGPTNPSYYAAGLCKTTIDSRSDWYLPSICEMGYDGRNESTGCGTVSAPTLQNLQSSLVNNGNVGGLAPVSSDNYYWSSTEYSGDPATYAWYQLFNVDQSSLQVHDVAKNGQFGVRCVRIFPIP